MPAPRVPLNFFGIPFGLAGLAEAWLTAAHQGHVPVAVGNVVCAVGAAVWVVVVACYGRYALSHRGALGTDLLDFVFAPFASLALISPMLLAAEGVAPYAPTAGKILVDVFLALTFLLGAWFTGQWIYGQLELDKLHPGYFLPTVAGGLVASGCAAQVGQTRLAEFMLGLGLVCWLILGSLIMFRLLFRPALPAPLQPTLAIEVAPAAVASMAYFSLDGGRTDTVAALLGGYGLLMVFAQIRLIPMFLRLHFAAGFWAFTFSWAAVAAAALRWNDSGRPAGHLVYTYLLLAAVSLLIGGIAVRTAIALFRGNLLPSPAPSSAPAAAAPAAAAEPAAATSD